LGVNIGYEQDGTGSNYDRPMLIIKGFNSQIFFAVALTGRKKMGKYYFHIGKIQGREASVLLSQVKVVDTKRLTRKICTIDATVFVQIKRALNRTLFDEF
jgi:mRNA interferase MazF